MILRCGRCGICLWVLYVHICVLTSFPFKIQISKLLIPKTSRDILSVHEKQKSGETLVLMRDQLKEIVCH